MAFEEQILNQSEPGSVVVVDCTDVDVFDVSFAATFFGKTQVRLPVNYPERFLVVCGLTVTTRKNLNSALKEAGLMLVEDDGESFHLRGKFSPSDEETLELLHEKRRPFTVREFADALSINVTAANERLTKLAKMAILQRQTVDSGRTKQVFVAPAI